MVNPALAFGTRAPGAPVEAWSGTGFVNSGIFSKESPAPGVPANDSFSLKFTKPGTYWYLCLVHVGGMLGTVEVVPPTGDVPSQAAIDAQGQKEIAPLMALVTMAREQGKQAGQQPGPNNTTTWFARAGLSEYISGDPRAQVLEFGPKSLTVKAGDTVVWGSTYFHTVTFNPVPPPPDFILATPQTNGPPLLLLNPLVGIPANPSGVFDPTKYFNSGVLGPFSQAWSWALTFNTPGTYEYICAVHLPNGMKGTIIVTAR